MSVNNFLDAVPFSVSGLQNLQVNTINGGGFITTINIAGQIAFLSWNSTTETLTIFIPNASSSITGLLTSTDWNTFNNKENGLTFTSPLTRGGIGGNTISFDTEMAKLMLKN
jgi:secreted trypsin-like serine protease